jgi:hypothetical protein
MMITNAPQAVDQARAPRRLGLLAIPVLSTAFGFVGSFTIGQPALAAFGLLWGIAAMLAAPRLARRGALSPTQANAPIYVMLPLACIVLGGSIIGHLAGPTPIAFLQLLQQPGYGFFFYAFHGPFEWLLMPWALMANWGHPARRKLLIVAAVIFYLGRTASALYFAPNALYWGGHPAEAAEHLDQLAVWIRLDLIRVVLQDVVTAALMLAAALHLKFGPLPSRVASSAEEVEQTRSRRRAGTSPPANQ